MISYYLLFIDILNEFLLEISQEVMNDGYAQIVSKIILSEVIANDTISIVTDSLSDVRSNIEKLYHDEDVKAIEG
jgi:hypothetical protein